MYHSSALLKESLEFLNVKAGLWYIDATLGGGGHTRGILRAGGNVVGIDVDSDAIQFVEKRFSTYIDAGRLRLVNSNFSEIDKIAKKFCPSPPVGILFDLGVSHHQVEEDSRGFSFNSDSALDMRMGKEVSVTARDLVNGLSKKELKLIFSKYGEERYAGKIAQAIFDKRKVCEIRTCRELAEIVGDVKGRRRFGKAHPATKVFQALRIVVNDELGVLSATLPRAFRVLAPKGRMLVISFHSLEDRIAKEFGRNNADKLRVLTKSPIVPGVLELSKNIRARSAKLRVFEKV